MGELFWERHELLQAEYFGKSTKSVENVWSVLRNPSSLSVVLFFFLAFAEATQVRRSCRDCGVGTVTFPLDSPLLLLQPTTVKRPRPSVSDEDGGSPLKRCSLAATPLKTED